MTTNINTHFQSVQLKPIATEKGTKIYTILYGRSNAYLIVCNQQVILVDTGKKSTYNLLKKNIQDVLPANTALNFLVLTHTHFDHCQSAHVLVKDFGCKVFASIHAVDFSQEGYTPIPGGTNIFSNFISSIGQKTGKKKFGYAPFTIDFPIDSDSTQMVTSEVQIIQTPGHSRDSISLIVDNEIAIVGDAMFGVFPKSIFPPFADDTIQLKKSWKKLLDTKCEVFLPGHGKPISRARLIKQFE